MEFPILYGQEKNGKTKVWKAKVESNQLQQGIVTITYGYLDGKQQVTQRVYTEGKNIGKKNETSPYQQAVLETESKWKDKHEKEQYALCPKETQIEKIFPMLASPYNEKKPIFPCDVQPKLDGLRCLFYQTTKGVVAQSRTGGEFETMGYIGCSLSPLFEVYPDVVLDGELYTSDIPFETLAGLIKKKYLTEEDKFKLQQHVRYHVYDIVCDEPWEVRKERLRDLVRDKRWNRYLVEVETVWTTKDEFKGHFLRCIENGFEGIMLRDVKGVYQKGYRSQFLQKYKEFLEDEFPIIGYEEGEGRDKGCVIWNCETKQGTFNVRPRGTMEQRRKWFQQGRTYIGKMLTVIYQELSEHGVPRFPVGKAIRDGY